MSWMGRGGRRRGALGYGMFHRLPDYVDLPFFLYFLSIFFFLCPFGFLSHLLLFYFPAVLSFFHSIFLFFPSIPLPFLPSLLFPIFLFSLLSHPFFNLLNLLFFSCPPISLSFYPSNLAAGSSGSPSG